MTQRAFNFGVGTACAMPQGGGPPIPFAALTDISVSFTGEVKEFYGASQFALDVSRGKVKIEGKAKFGIMNLLLYNAVFFGQAVTTGEVLNAYNEAGIVPAVTTYTITVANSAHFLYDLGVYYANTGVQLTQVTSGPTIGQYTVAAGVYTFAAADASAAMLLNYDYSSAATGSTLAVNNSLMGVIPSFQLSMQNTSKGKSMSLLLYSCVASKFDIPMKNDDYTTVEIDFMAQDNGAGQVVKLTNTGG